MKTKLGQAGAVRGSRNGRPRWERPTPPRFVFSVSHNGGRPVMTKRPVLRMDDMWVLLPHAHKIDRTTKLLRGAVIFSEREAWRRHVVRARAAHKNAQQSLRWARKELPSAVRRARVAAAELRRVKRLAGRG